MPKLWFRRGSRPSKSDAIRCRACLIPILGNEFEIVKSKSWKVRRILLRDANDSLGNLCRFCEFGKLGLQCTHPTL